MAMESVDNLPLQLDISNLIERLHSETGERVFGKIRLGTPESREVFCQGFEKPLVLSRYEYVILWALVSVSRSTDTVGGYISGRDLHTILQSIFGREYAKKSSSSSSDARLIKGPEEWYDEALPEGQTKNRLYNSEEVLIGKINRELHASFKDAITIMNQPRRGYYLKAN